VKAKRLPSSVNCKSPTDILDASDVTFVTCKHTDLVRSTKTILWTSVNLLFSASYNVHKLHLPKPNLQTVVLTGPENTSNLWGCIRKTIRTQHSKTSFQTLYIWLILFKLCVLLTITGHWLQRLSIPSLELRHLQADLLWCYNTVFGMFDLNFDKLFEWSPHLGTRGHKYKLRKMLTCTQIRSEFFSECVITVWNELSVSTDFSTITRFKGSILNANFSDYLVCFNYVLFCCTSFCILCVCFYCTSPGAVVSVPCALLSSHTYLCPCNCLHLFYDKINDDDHDDDNTMTTWILLNCMYLNVVHITCKQII